MPIPFRLHFVGLYTILNKYKTDIGLFNMISIFYFLSNTNKL